MTPAWQLLAVAYVKQAEDAVQSGNASQVLASASKVVEYDESTVIPPAVLQVFADESVKRFEQSSSDANQTAALAALSGIQSIDVENEELPVLRKRVTAAVLKRGESVADKAPDSALKDYEKALSLGASVTDSASLKTKLVTALTARCRQSLGIQNVAGASVDCMAVMKLDSQAASSLVADFEKLPASVLTQLPSSVLLSVIVKLPVKSNSLGMAFKPLPGGTFTMGEGSEAHQVTLTKAFELGVHEVTQEQYEAVMDTNPSKFKVKQNPVEVVSWYDAVEFCRKLSALPAEQSAGFKYRLPTEAEWEYACRARTTTKYSFGDSDSELGEYAWFDDKSADTTHPVGGKKPNAWGLYDMHGNVYEWCQDWYGDYPSGAVTDPTGAASGSVRVNRGGCWFNFSVYCRSANRFWDTPDVRGSYLGFRVLRSSIKKSQHASQPVGQPLSPAVSPFDAEEAKAHQAAWAEHLGTPVETTNSIGMELMLIPPGEFMMGSGDYTLHKVTLTKAFELGVYEVTQQQYEKVMGTNPSHFKGPQNPVENVSWDDAVEFCRKLSERPEEKLAGYVYRLPTEAEWEYACRAGTTTEYSFGDDESEFGDYAWYTTNAGKTTHSVGCKKPNPWGLYDMHGNVNEWCQDWYGNYPSGAVTDPTGPSSDSYRVYRGGSWCSYSVSCRSAFRDGDSPGRRFYHLGFRVLRSSIK